jgi:hypothetical protein
MRKITGSVQKKASKVQQGGGRKRLFETFNSVVEPSKGERKVTPVPEELAFYMILEYNLFKLIRISRHRKAEAKCH